MACEKNLGEVVMVLLDFKAPRDQKVLGMLYGDARKVVMERLEAEDKELKRLEAEKRLAQGPW